MKNILRITLLLIIFSKQIRAQSLERIVIASQGNYFTNAFGSLSWTLGEISIETYSVPNSILTQGFQQIDTILSTGIYINNLFGDLKVWPNPVKDFVYIKTSAENFDVKIFDLNGRMIHEAKGCFEKARIDLSELALGAYIINISNAKRTINQNIKCLKTE